VILFARTLRGAGVAVRAGGVPDALRALAEVGLTRRDDVHDALRTVLVSRQEDLRPFDEMFERFWRAWSREERPAVAQPMHVPSRARSTLHISAATPGSRAGADPGASNQPDRELGVQTYSHEESWRRKDFATFTADDIARAEEAMTQLVWNPGDRLTRRWAAAHGGAVDLRRLVGVNMKHGGELLEVPRRARRKAPRPLVLICDVSGSMEAYARMLMLFAQAIAGNERRVEVFLFSTRLTRVTRQFADRQPGRALVRARDAVPDWSGGTRIGEALRSFNTRWARRVLRRQPVVLLISDGWDLGDPALLSREVARLQRAVYRLIWLNPLIGSPGYEPLTRGMRAALPFVDDFLSVRDMFSIDALARHLNALGPGPSAGVRH
jgi:uncharacterized protein with von Willebrand factor type A (vWA) domain